MAIQDSENVKQVMAEAMLQLDGGLKGLANLAQGLPEEIKSAMERNIREIRNARADLTSVNDYLSRGGLKR